MKRFVLSVLAVAVLLMVLALVFGTLLLKDPGSVLVVVGERKVTTSVAMAVAAGLVYTFLLIVLTLMVSPLWRLLTPAHWSRRRLRRQADRHLQRGLHALVEGDWKDAEAHLKFAANHLQWPLPALLGAAVAARQRRDAHAERYWLQCAEEYPRGDLPASLLAARWALNDGRHEQALERLQALRKQHGDSTQLLQMLAEALARNGDWMALATLLQDLQRLDPDPQMPLRERRAWLGVMRQVANDAEIPTPEERRARLLRTWKRMPQSLHRDPALVAQFAGYLAQFGDGRAALERVRVALDRQWDDALPPVLEAIDDVPPEQLLKQLEAWLADRPAQPVLLLTAGRVALKAKLWGQARSYFDAAARAGHATAQAELLRLSEALGERDGRLDAVRRRLIETGYSLPDLPLPTPRVTAPAVDRG